MNFLKRLFGGGGVQNSPDSTPTGTKIELIAMIEELTANSGDLMAREVKAAQTIVASKRFSIEVVKELVLESFYDNMPMDVRNRNGVRSVSMLIGANMGKASFAQWLCDNIVVGRLPAQMMDSPRRYGAFGMWRDAKDLCEKHGITFGRS